MLTIGRPPYQTCIARRIKKVFIFVQPLRDLNHCHCFWLYHWGEPERVPYTSLVVIVYGSTAIP